MPTLHFAHEATAFDLAIRKIIYTTNAIESFKQDFLKIDQNVWVISDR